MTKNSFSHWILNRLTYVQTFIIVCIIFFISLFPILYFWVKTHLQQIHHINGEILDIEEEFLLKDLYTEIQDHRFNFQFFLAGDHSYQSKVEESKTAFIKTLQAISQLNQSNPGVSIRSSHLLQRIDPKNLLGKWQELSQNNPFSLTPNKSEVLHTTLIENLQIEFAYLTSQVNLEDINEQENFRLAEGFALRFPFLQENLSLLTLLKSSSLLSLKIDRQDERIAVLIDRVRFDLNYLNQALETFETRNPTAFNESLAHQWQGYYDSVIEILKFVTKYPTQESPSHHLFDEFVDLSKKTREIGSEIWTTSLKTLKEIFIYQRSVIQKELWSILLLTLFLGSIAFILGLIVTRLANARLIQLTEATESFTNGNLSVRLPEKFNDEIGKQVHAFNRMAEKLEEMIRFLFELLKSTTELANGNLSARLSSQYNNQEFDQVAHSFNKMAGTFEEIIGQLQTMIKTLANSAQEITTASKEQQTLIFDQEGATKEMALAAADIYSSSKDFVITIEEMSEIASQTSHLTQEGKEALTHMESIMHQLIDASKHIASRISTLSEQAQNITGVITTITKFADQTNLLSLNASIEAEKAGEYGRGFAVIAREIRRLADQTATSTLDIEKIISEITQAVNSTVLGVNDFTQVIRQSVSEIRQVGEQQTKVIEQVQTFTSRFDQINEGMQIQSAGASQINTSIENLSKKAQQTTSAIQKLNKTIQQLRDTSNALRNLTDFSHLSEKPNTENKIPSINIDLK